MKTPNRRRNHARRLKKEVYMKTNKVTKQRDLLDSLACKKW